MRNDMDNQIQTLEDTSTDLENQIGEYKNSTDKVIENLATKLKVEMKTITESTNDTEIQLKLLKEGLSDMRNKTQSQNLMEQQRKIESQLETLVGTSNLPAYSGNHSHFITLVAEICRKYLI